MQVQTVVLNTPCFGFWEAWAGAADSLLRLEALPPVEPQHRRSWSSDSSPSRSPSGRARAICETCGCGPDDCPCVVPMFPLPPSAAEGLAAKAAARPAAKAAAGPAAEAAAVPAAAQRQGGRRNADGTLRPRGGRNREKWAAWFGKGKGKRDQQR